MFRNQLIYQQQNQSERLVNQYKDQIVLLILIKVKIAQLTNVNRKRFAVIKQAIKGWQD